MHLQARAEELAGDLASLQTLCRDVEQHSEQMHARLSHKLQGELQVGRSRTATLICSGLRLLSVVEHSAAQLSCSELLTFSTSHQSAGSW